MRHGTRHGLAALLLIALVGAAAPAHAGFRVGGSIGEGLIFKDGTHRTPVNFEVLPSYEIGILSADVGVVFHLEDQVDLIVRPGVRVNLWLLYARAAIPMRVTNDFDWGFMVGLGANVLNLGVVSLFVEADASFYKSTDFKTIPIEARAGIQIGF